MKQVISRCHLRSRWRVWSSCLSFRWSGSSARTCSLTLFRFLRPCTLHILSGSCAGVCSHILALCSRLLFSSGLPSLISCFRSLSEGYCWPLLVYRRGFSFLWCSDCCSSSLVSRIPHMSCWLWTYITRPSSVWDLQADCLLYWVHPTGYPSLARFLICKSDTF